MRDFPPLSVLVSIIVVLGALGIAVGTILVWTHLLGRFLDPNGPLFARVCWTILAISLVGVIVCIWLCREGLSWERSLSARFDNARQTKASRERACALEREQLWESLFISRHFPTRQRQYLYLPVTGNIELSTHEAHRLRMLTDLRAVIGAHYRSCEDEICRHAEDRYERSLFEHDVARLFGTDIVVTHSNRTHDGIHVSHEYTVDIYEQWPSDDVASFEELLTRRAIHFIQLLQMLAVRSRLRDKYATISPFVSLELSRAEFMMRLRACPCVPPSPSGDNCENAYAALSGYLNLRLLASQKGRHNEILSWEFEFPELEALEVTLTTHLDSLEPEIRKLEEEKRAGALKEQEREERRSDLNKLDRNIEEYKAELLADIPDITVMEMRQRLKTRFRYEDLYPDWESWKRTGEM